MGRPIKKSFFKDPASAGYQITLTADVGAGAEECFIVSQRGTRKYKCQSIATGTQLDCFLIDGAPAAPGQAQLVLNGENVRTLYQYIAKTYAGNVYTWDRDGFTGATYTGEVIGTDSDTIV